MTEKHNLNSTTAADATTWADDVDDTVNRLSGLNLGRLTNIAGTNAITGRLPMSAGFTGISDGARFSFVVGTTNTGAVTMQLKNTGGTNVGASFALRTAGGVAFAGGELVAGQHVEFEYSSAEGYARRVSPGGIAVSGVPNALLYHKTTSGTGGGATTSGSWQTRPLNTEYDPNSLITLSANQFVPAVSGWVRWWSSIFDPGDSGSRIYNVTDAVAVDPVGINLSGLNSNDATQISVGSCPVVGGKTYRLEYRVATTNANGLGAAKSWGDEVYALLEFFRNPL